MQCITVIRTLANVTVTVICSRRNSLYLQSASLPLTGSGWKALVAAVRAGSSLFPLLSRLSSFFPVFIRFLRPILDYRAYSQATRKAHCPSWPGDQKLDSNLMINMIFILSPPPSPSPPFSFPPPPFSSLLAVLVEYS